MTIQSRFQPKPITQQKSEANVVATQKSQTEASVDAKKTGSTSELNGSKFDTGSGTQTFPNDGLAHEQTAQGELSQSSSTFMRSAGVSEESLLTNKASDFLRAGKAHAQRTEDLLDVNVVDDPPVRKEVAQHDAAVSKFAAANPQLPLESFAMLASATQQDDLRADLCAAFLDANMSDLSPTQAAQLAKLDDTLGGSNHILRTFMEANKSELGRSGFDALQEGVHIVSSVGREIDALKNIMTSGLG